MAFIAKQRYKLDIAPKGGWVIVYASQHDNGAREIEFEITNQGNAYSIPASINISVQGVKSNSGYFSHSCSYSGNVVTMALADDMTDIIGKAICVLKFTNSSQQKLATAKFILNVDTDSSSEGIIIDTEAEEIFNQMLNDIRAQAASISADIAELQSMVGSPLVASTVSAMTDRNKIYVYTGSKSGYTNGNWYYWNGSAWTSGGVYNSTAFETDKTLSVEGMAADAKAVGDNIYNLLYLPIDESEFISGKYIWSDGKAYNGSNYIISTYIRCAFKKIKFNCLTSGSGIQCVAFYSEENEISFIGGYENTEPLSTYPVHEMDVPENTKYIRISKNANSLYTVNTAPYVKLAETSESMLERVENAKATADEALYKVENIDTSDILSDVYRPVYSDANLIPSDGMLKHSYVDDTGTVKTSTNQSADVYNFVLSGYIPVEHGKTLYLSGDDFFYNRYFAWYDADKNYIGGKSLSGGMGFSAHVAFVIVPNSAAYLRITFRTTENAAVAWAGYTGTAPTGEAINATNAGYLDYHYYPENPCDFIGRDICTFNKILCIGDSITAGYFNHSGGGQTIAKYSYPVYLKKITGVECINMGDSGETSVSWWQIYQNTDFTGYDCAIINLGINDALLSVTEEDTRTAFTNIINALKTANTGIKIFIANVIPAYARGNTTYDAINAIIEDIATNTENCYFIDLTRYGHAVGVAYANGHLTAVGYWMLAEDYANAISHIIRNNPESFRFIQFIGTDLHN